MGRRHYPPRPPLAKRPVQGFRSRIFAVSFSSPSARASFSYLRLPLKIMLPLIPAFRARVAGLILAPVSEFAVAASGIHGGVRAPGLAIANGRAS